VAVEHVAQYQIVDVALVTGQQDQRGVASSLTDAFEALFVEHDSVVHLGPNPGEEPVEKIDHQEVLLRAKVPELLAGHVLGLRVRNALLFGVPLDVCSDPRTTQKLVLDPCAGLLHRAEDDGPIALHAPKQRVSNLVSDLGVGQVGVLFDELLEIKRFPRAELCVPVVQQELEQHPHSARPLHGAEQQVE
jgi:hypothetical protein